MTLTAGCGRVQSVARTMNEGLLYIAFQPVELLEL